MENFNTEHAQPISDEDLQWVEELLPTADGNVLAPMLMMQRMAARIRQLEVQVSDAEYEHQQYASLREHMATQPQVNEAGVIAELRAWLSERRAGWSRVEATGVISGAERARVHARADSHDSVLRKLQELVAQHAERARAGRVAEIKQFYSYMDKHFLAIGIDPPSDRRTVEQRAQAWADAYLGSPESDIPKTDS